MKYKKKDHRNWRETGETKWIDLYSFRTETTSRKLMYIDDAGQIYKDEFSFREENHRKEKKENIQKK